jgi:hopanoid biosynthesis associated protein HpnK
MASASPTGSPPGKRLIVTADDFGMNIAVNEAVEQAYDNGILTCASLMMGGAAVKDAVERAHRMKGLGVGLHITLADGRPVSPRALVRGLTDQEGRFRNDLVGSGIRWFFNPLVRLQLAREINAQFQAFAATGLVLDHVNTHKHLHFHPTLMAMLISIGRRYGMLALRIPEEPRGVLLEADPDAEIPKARLGFLVQSMRRRAKRARLAYNDNIFGLAWSGGMTEARLLSLIPHLPEGLNELYSHPAAAADPTEMQNSAPDYLYRDELSALLSPRVRQALIDNNVTLVRFAGASPKSEIRA